MRTLKFKVALGTFFALLAGSLADGAVSSEEFGALAVSLIGAGLVWLLPNASDETREEVATDIYAEVAKAVKEIQDKLAEEEEFEVTGDTELGLTLDGQPKRTQEDIVRSTRRGGSAE